MSASIAPFNTHTGAQAEGEGIRRSQKAEDAYRTISEVADELHVAQHVLRFWESKFKAIEPLKRAGGRRYYSRENVALLKRVHYLLYTQGYTIKGVQKLLLKDRALLATVPDLDAARAGTQAHTALPSLSSTASAALLPPVANEPAARMEEPLGLFAASDRILMNEVLCRLKDIQSALAA